MKTLLTLSLSFGILINSWSQDCDTSGYQGPQFYDTYHEYYNQESKWAHYNVHDPTVCKDGEWYYMYCTDVGMGWDAGSGCLKRRSRNLVNWEFLGRAFDGVPDSARNFFLIYNPEYTDTGIWAPFIHKYKDEYRLYYSAPGGLGGQNLAFIGYAVSDSANGPWEERGRVASSIPGDTINAIDPTVVIDSVTGHHWMAYGSYQKGIYIVELDSATGGLKTPGDRGVRIAGRSGGRHASIEGAELNYRNGWYYLFVSYDWLETFYNVRVGRSRYPYGPYYDIKGINMALYSDNWPMIQTPYRFNDHEGWQGTAHCAVYNDSGMYYMFNQGRPSTSIYNMVLHVREIYWLDDWPVLSPERYAAVPQCSFSSDSLVGKWEHLLLIYNTSVPHSTSSTIELCANGTIDNNPVNSWTLQDSLLTMSWNNGLYIDKCIVHWGWDWEYRCVTLLYTGMNADGLCMWGKKSNQKAVDTYTKIISGATYTVRNHYSNMLMEVPGGADVNGTSIRQGKDNGEPYQLWTIKETGDGYYKFVSFCSDTGRVMEVYNGSTYNGANIRLNQHEWHDKQKFKIIYNDNGYFRILTKVSNDARCVDLFNFSIVQGGNICQWDYLQGVNQAWRFKMIDTIEIDTVTMIDTTVGVFTNHQPCLQIYPNPNNDGNININLERLYGAEDISISVFDDKGAQVYYTRNVTFPVHSIEMRLSPGIYLIRINTKQKQYLEKWAIY